MSDNYVIKRQSIKLLGELLLDRANYNVMTKYVDSSEHLKICMTLLRDDRRMINYEAFHVFKVPSISLGFKAERKLSRYRCLSPIQTSRCRSSACSSTTATGCSSSCRDFWTTERTMTSSTMRRASSSGRSKCCRRNPHPRRRDFFGLSRSLSIARPFFRCFCMGMELGKGLGVCCVGCCMSRF